MDDFEFHMERLAALETPGERIECFIEDWLLMESIVGDQLELFEEEF